MTAIGAFLPKRWSAVGPKRTFLAHSRGVLLSRIYLLVRVMTGKFLRRGAVVDTIKSDERMNAQQKRAGKTRYHVDVVSCGCPDENCGAFHVLRTERPLPTIAEAEATLVAHRRTRKTRDE
ncbi:hypothetical protein FE844_031310 (plasmid) [Rhizobium indicum]|uniref:hypothetical protein n=1 Tax=Rhizobium indicum TaxID=2583231 RepID=UPI0011074BC2|nr:hypothetical protein [Rhizobium indicum]QKK34066.1 hypothetical protein FE844_031310 [Rhizobium indicum]